MRTVVLTGAGAAKPWGGPLASQVDEVLCEDRKFMTSSGKPLGAYLYELLRSTAVRPEDVNFETVINAVEELYGLESELDLSTYRSTRGHPSPSFSALSPRLFELKADVAREIFGLDTAYNRVDDLGTAVYSSPGYEDDVATFGGDTERSTLCHRAHAHYINLVIGLIAEYAERAPLETALNAQYDDFLKSLASSGPVRLYSLNYDRVPSECSSVDFFDGFRDDGSGVRRMDLSRVLRDDDAHVAFNVHGSIYYEEDGPTGNWICTPGKVTRIQVGRSDERDQSGRPLIVTPIVTGLQKSSRILQRPSAEFYQRLCWDCAHADAVVVVGYSFGDLHINHALRDAVSLGVPIRHVTYFSRREVDDVDFGGLDPWSSDVDRYLRSVEGLPGDYFDPPRLDRDDEWATSARGGQAIFSWGFDAFLEREAWKQWP